MERRKDKKALGLKIVGGQSFLVNEYTALEKQGKVALVSAPIGDLQIKVEEGKAASSKNPLI